MNGRLVHRWSGRRKDEAEHRNERKANYTSTRSRNRISTRLRRSFSIGLRLVNRLRSTTTAFETDQQYGKHGEHSGNLSKFESIQMLIQIDIDIYL